MHDPIFDSFTSDQLSQICKLMSFDPTVSNTPFRCLSALPEEAASAWLASNTNAIEQEVLRLGSWSFGDQKSYREIVRALAAKMGVSVSFADSVEKIECAIIVKIWNDAVGKLTPEQVEELRERTRTISTQYGKSLGTELTGFAALAAAQVSGFGVYMLGSTLLGAINGALGLGLGFGAFMGLSSLIATVTGPIGWAALGMFAILKMGAPNYKNLLPVVILIATQRSLNGETGRNTENLALPPSPTALRGESKQVAVAKAPEVIRPVKAVATIPNASDRVLATRDYLAVFEAEVQSATSAAQTSRRIKAKSLPLRRVASKLEKHVFDLKPENRLLRDVARESVDDHFLDLTEAEQADVRAMVRERRPMEEATAVQNRQDAEHATRDDKQRLVAEKKLNAKTAKDNAKTHGKAQTLRNSRNVLKASFPNLQFSERALERYKSYGGSVLHSSFASKFRSLDQGNIVDKHHVPATTPKVFQMDCGGHGKLYYRRGSDGHSICVELLGDKNSQPRDLGTLQAG